ncbi:MAG: Gldg family protein [Spirochaetes bacterium]|nr:Gldg family protein [Spirochaetota bacterium]
MRMRELYDRIRRKAEEEFRLGEKNLQLLLIIFIILLVNLAGQTLNVRLDLTRNRVYSLSKKSREVVSNLNEKLTVRVLFSRDLPPQHSAVFRYLKDLLEEYDYYGNRNFRYEIVAEKDLEKTAGDYGITPVMSKEFVSDQVKLRRTYMGLVVQQADVIEKMNAVTSTGGIEYTITSLMQKVSSKVDGLLRLQRPIEVKFYLDPNVKFLPIEGISTVEEKVRKAVEKCNQRSYDKLKFQVVDPSKGPGSRVVASTYGLSMLSWKGGTGTFGKAVPAGDYLMGMVLEGQGRAEPIDIGVAPTIFGKNVLVGMNNLEDRISGAVDSLVTTNPKVGYIAGHGEVDLNDRQSRDGGWFFRLLLSDVYQVTEIDLKEGDIPSDVQTIIINGPTAEFSPDELYKIDQFLMKGKKAVIFARSFAELRLPGQMQMQGGPRMMPVKTGLEELLKHYGVMVNSDFVLDKSCAKVQLESFIADYPVVPIIKESGLNRESIITGYLKGIAMDRVSSIDLDKKRIADLGLVSRELVRSSPESWIMKGNINLHPLLMSPPPNAQYGSKTLAVLVAGRFESFFKGQEAPAPAPDTEGKGPKGAAPARGALATVTRLDETVPSGTTEIVVVGSSEITTSGFLDDADKILSSGMPRGDAEAFPNGLFLHNMVDYCAGNFYIPELRSKRLEYNPLERIGDSMKSLYKVLNMAGLPVLVLLFGFITWRRYHMRRKLIQNEFSREV